MQRLAESFGRDNRLPIGEWSEPFDGVSDKLPSRFDKSLISRQRFRVRRLEQRIGSRMRHGVCIGRNYACVLRRFVGTLINQSRTYPVDPLTSRFKVGT